MLSVPLHAGCFVLGERYRKDRSGSRLLLPVFATGRSCLFGGEAVEIFTGVSLAACYSVAIALS